MWKSFGFNCYLLFFRDRCYKSENVGSADKFKSIVFRIRQKLDKSIVCAFLLYLNRFFFFNYLRQIKIYILFIMRIQGIFGKFVHNEDFSRKFWTNEIAYS